MKKIIILAMLLLLISLASAFDYKLYDNMEAGVNTSLWTNTGCSASTAQAYEGNKSVSCPNGANSYQSTNLSDSLSTTGVYILSYWTRASGATVSDCNQPNFANNALTACFNMNGGYPVDHYWGRTVGASWTSSNLPSDDSHYPSQQNNTWTNIRLKIDNDGNTYNIQFFNTTTNSSGNWTAAQALGACNDLQEIKMIPSLCTIYIDKVEVWNYSTYGWTYSSGNTTTPTLSFNANTTGSSTNFNETQNWIYASVYANNLPGHNTTTLYLYNSTGLYLNLTTTTLLNYSYNFTNLPPETYYLNATASNGTATASTATPTIIIYSLLTNINSPANGSQIKRNLSITYNTTILPTGAVSISGNNISLRNPDGTLNYTINGSTNITPYFFDTYTQNFTTGAYKLRVEATDNQGNKKSMTLDINLTRNANLNLSANFALNTSQTIQNFTINITDLATGTIESYNTTSYNLSIEIIKTRNYNITIDAPGYVVTTTTYTATNQTYQNLTLQTYTNNSINIYVYDESTGIIILQNITIVTTGTFETTYTTTTGNLYIDGLIDGNYSIKLSGANYTLKTYTVTVGSRSTQTLNAYLSANSANAIFTIMDYDSSQVLEGATFSQYRLINGTYTLIDTRNSDITGRVQITYLPSVKYQFITSLTGYITSQFYLDPVLFSSYNVRLTKTTILTESNTPSGLGVSVTYDNTLFYANQTNTLQWTISSPTGNLMNYSLNISYPGGNNAFQGNNAIGEQFTASFNITGATMTSQVKISYCYDTTTGSQKCFAYPYGIIGGNNPYTFLGNRNNTYGLGILERTLIVTLIVLIVGGMAFMFGGLLAGLPISLFLLGYFYYTGFINLWVILPSMLVGIVLIMGRSGQ